MKRTAVLCLLLLVFLTGCERGAESNSSDANESSGQQQETLNSTTAPAKEMQAMQQNLILMVNDRVIPATWEDNDSVAELIRRAAQEEIRVEMNPYGGWEQVGSLGHSISRNDVQMTALPGDIMLYSGNQIVLFYGENSWAYTKLGHIDLPENETTALLSGGAVSITLAVQ